MSTDGGFDGRGWKGLIVLLQKPIGNDPMKIQCNLAFHEVRQVVEKSD